MPTASTAVEIILQAKNLADKAFQDAIKGLTGVEAAGGEASDALQRTGNSANEAGDDLERGAASSAQMAELLEKLDGTLGRVSSALDKTAKETDQLKKKQEDAGKSGESFITRLSHMGNVAGMLKDIFRSVGQFVSQSLQRLAADGDKMAGSLMGQFESMSKGADKVVSSFVKGLAPALVPVTRALGELAQMTADWIEKNDIGRRSVDFLLKALAFILTGIDKSIVGWRMLGEVIVFLFNQSVGHAQAGAAKIVRALSTIVESMVGPAILANRELGNEFAAVSYRMDKTADAWEKSAAKWKNSNLVLDETPTFAGRAAESLLDLAGKSQQSSDAMAGAFFSTKEAAKAAAEALKARQEAMQNDFAFEMELTEGNLQRKIEITEEYLPRIAELYGIHSQQLKEAEDSLFFLQLEHETQRQEAFQLTANVVASTGQQMLTTFSAIGNGLMSLTRDSEQSQALTVAAQKKASQQIISDFQSRFAKMQSLAAGGINALISGEKNLGQSLIQMTLETTKSLIGDLGSRVTQAMALQATATKGVLSAENAQKLAALGSLPAKVASAFAALGPLGPPLAAAALAALSALASRVLKFQGGGSFSGRVPGSGRQDTFPALYAPDEFVFRRESADRIGKPALDFMNETGQIPAVAGAGGGGESFSLRISYGDMPPDREIVRTLMQGFNFEVLNRRGEVIASHFKGLRT